MKYTIAIISILLTTSCNETNIKNNQEQQQNILGFTSISADRFNGKIRSTTIKTYKIILSENDNIQITDSLDAIHQISYSENGYTLQNLRYNAAGDTFGNIQYGFSNGIPTYYTSKRNGIIEDSTSITYPNKLTATKKTKYSDNGSFSNSEINVEYNDDGSIKQETLKLYYKNASRGYVETKTTYRYSGDTTTMTTNSDLTNETNIRQIIYKDRDMHGNPRKCIHYNQQNNNFDMQTFEFKYY